MKTSLFALSLGMLFLLSSCSPRLTPFTQDLYKDNNWTEQDLKQIQFYVSEDIVLYKEIRSGSSEIVSGEIKMKNGRQIEEVLIKKGTPGIFVYEKNRDRFAISFEEGGKELHFGINPKKDNRYYLFADWQKYRKGKVKYDGREFNLNTESSRAMLLVDLKKYRKTSVDSRKVKGRKI